MRIAQLCILIVFAAQVCIRTTYGAILLSANYSLIADALDRTPGLPPKPPSIVKVGGVHLDVNPGPFLFEPEARIEHGESTAVLHGTVRAEVGSIGLGLAGGAVSSGGPLTEAGGASFRAIQANAGWLEFIVPRVRNKAVGQPIIFNTLIVIEGDLAANLTGGEHNTPGFARAALEFYEDSSGSTLPDPPISGVYWALLREHPSSNEHILESAPGVIRVRHVMNNGLSYTLANRMSLTGEGNAANGGTTILTANFDSSIKWGGVESVTDHLGNPIPREDWTIESESGFDYSRSFDEQQVPEPSSVLLLGIALCARLMSGRRRRSRVGTN